MALQFGDQLGLSAQQIEDLEELRTGIERDVEPLGAEIDLLRTQILAGEGSALDGLARLRELQDLYQDSAAPYRAGVAEILTPEQHLMLQDMMFSTRSTAGWGPRGTGVAFGRGLGARGAQGPDLGYGRGAGLGYGRGAGLGYGRGIRPGYGRGLRQGSARFYPGHRFLRGGRRWR
jgi:hypothetical protein